MHPGARETHTLSSYFFCSFSSFLCSEFTYCSKLSQKLSNRIPGIVVGFKGACSLICTRFKNIGAGEGVYKSLQKARTTFKVDHSRWAMARDAHNSRIMDLRNNNNKDRMVFGSL